MSKNLCAKTRKVDDPYEIWVNGGWSRADGEDRAKMSDYDPNFRAVQLHQRIGFQSLNDVR